MRLVLCLVVVSLLVALATPAVADPNWAEGEAASEQLEDGGAELVSEAAVGGAPDGDGGDAGPGEAGEMEASDGAVTYYWDGPTRVHSEHCPDSLVYQLVRRDTSTDPPKEEILRSKCVSDVDLSEPTGPGEELAPPTPTVGEMRAEVVEQIDPPGVHTSPSPEHGGIAGMETWFWYDGPQEVVAEASVRGYTVTATMRPSRFAWEPCAHFEAATEDHSGEALGCPAVLESAEPGDEPDPDSDGEAAAATFVYETTGHYVIRHQVVWDGTWEFAGHGASTSGTLPTVRTTGETAYQVEEVRSVLVPRRADDE